MVILITRNDHFSSILNVLKNGIQISELVMSTNADSIR